VDLSRSGDQEIPVFYVYRIFFVLFIRVRQWTLSWVSSYQTTS